MYILKADGSLENIIKALSSYIANMVLQKQYFNYNGELLPEPKELPPVVYDGVEYYIYTTKFHIITTRTYDLGDNNMIRNHVYKLLDKLNKDDHHVIQPYRSDHHTLSLGQYSNIVISSKKKHIPQDGSSVLFNILKAPISCMNNVSNIETMCMYHYSIILDIDHVFSDEFYDKYSDGLSMAFITEYDPLKCHTLSK